MEVEEDKMKWKKKEKIYPKEYSTRQRYIFTWYPVTISGETRWLWFYKVEEIHYYGTCRLLGDEKFYPEFGFWSYSRWID